MTSKEELLIKRAVQLLLSTANLNENKLMEVADLLPDWEVGVHYQPGTIVKYGTHENGDAQLWQVAKHHVSSENNNPQYNYDTYWNTEKGLYRKLGFDMKVGHQVWRKPINSDYGYSKDKIVSHQGFVFKSDIDNNTFSPNESNWSTYE